MPAVAQERVSIEQIQLVAPRSTPDGSQRAIQESDYILGAQSGILLLTTAQPLPQSAAANQARALQLGNNNVATIDATGVANIAIQSVVGNTNTVNQQQIGSSNSSNVIIAGSGNNVGTRQQDVIGASTTIAVRGDNNTISAEQIRNATPISISQFGNGGNVSVSVSRK